MVPNSEQVKGQWSLKEGQKPDKSPLSEECRVTQGNRQCQWMANPWQQNVEPTTKLRELPLPNYEGEEDQTQRDIRLVTEVVRYLIPMSRSGKGSSKLWAHFTWKSSHSQSNTYALYICHSPPQDSGGNVGFTPEETGLVFIPTKFHQGRKGRKRRVGLKHWG